ncbi:ras-like GTP-binding protein Rho1 [Halyomorpha halys]|uniref:ras-like GTP-binding protein Rho1 n=1 Tax=Halyomorpha halys TaxID=286706 RepID=UPI0006D4EFFA|nr:ras-like GTP-binding protein Rho1 [Halyomorpha halys]
MDNIKTEKILFVGDAMCGKTSILQVFTKGHFPQGCYTPTIFENEVADMSYKKKHFKLFLVDSSGQEDWQHIRSLLYCDVEVIVIVCSIDSIDSLENVREYWVPEIKEFAPPGIPKLLVANKKDLRDGSKDQIEYKEGEIMAKEIGAYAYLECSALRYEGIEEIFFSIVKLLKKNTGCSCVIL